MRQQNRILAQKSPAVGGLPSQMWEVVTNINIRAETSIAETISQDRPSEDI